MVERDIKQLLKNIIDHSITNNVHDNQSYSNQTTMASSLPSSSSQNKRSTVKSALASFLDSVSTKTTNKYSIRSNSSNTIGDKLLLYKSLAMKEAERIINAGLNPNPLDFW
jgi:hypothetical protein